MNNNNKSQRGIIYSLVARREVVLAYQTSTSGNFVGVVTFILKKLPAEDSAQLSYSYDGYHFHILIEDGLTFLCLTEETFDRRVAFAFLFDAKSRFVSRYSAEQYNSARSFAFNSEFARILANQMDYYSHNPTEDKINAIKEQTHATRKQLSENIDKLLSRQERVELLVGKTETAAEQSEKFHEQGRKLLWKLWLRNAKYYAFIVILGLIILWLFLSLFCGIGLNRC